MNGAEHYREAERLLTRAQSSEFPQGHAAYVSDAQVHATLAAAAASALPAVKRYYGDDSDTDREWAGVAS